MKNYKPINNKSKSKKLKKTMKTLKKIQMMKMNSKWKKVMFNSQTINKTLSFYYLLCYGYNFKKTSSQLSEFNYKHNIAREYPWVK